MAQVFALTAETDWADLTEGEVRVIPLLQYENGVRVRMLVTRCGAWPKHVEDQAELYVVLKGEVIYITEREHRVKAGEAILLAPGEPHGARVERGAVSINVDLARRPSPPAPANARDGQLTGPRRARSAEGPGRRESREGP